MRDFSRLSPLQELPVSGSSGGSPRAVLSRVSRLNGTLNERSATVTHPLGGIRRSELPRAASCAPSSRALFSQRVVGGGGVVEGSPTVNRGIHARAVGPRTNVSSGDNEGLSAVDSCLLPPLVGRSWNIRGGVLQVTTTPPPGRASNGDGYCRSDVSADRTARRRNAADITDR